MEIEKITSGTGGGGRVRFQFLQCRKICWEDVGEKDSKNIRSGTGREFEEFGLVEERKSMIGKFLYLIDLCQ